MVPANSPISKKTPRQNKIEATDTTILTEAAEL
jgi:hypothetical protein